MTLSKVKAKMYCESVTLTGGLATNKQETVKLRAVTYDTGENATYSKFTPSGTLELMVTNEAIFGHFQPGKEYYIDIVEALPEKSE